MICDNHFPTGRGPTGRRMRLPQCGSSTGAVAPNQLVVSYNVNSTDNALDGDIFRDVSIYRPRFVAVTLADDGVQRCA